MTPADQKRMTDIVARWEKRAGRYPDDFKFNRLQMLPVAEVIEDIPFLIQLAIDADQDLPPADAARLENLDREFQEFEQFNRKDADAGRRVPMGLGRLVRTVRFLVGIVSQGSPPSVPAATTPTP